MYHIKMAFALVQVGANLWVNPMQVQGVTAAKADYGRISDCQTYIILSTSDPSWCSDWSIEQVRDALKPAAVSRALEDK